MNTMKKSTKTILSIAAILAVIGIVFIIVGACMGVNLQRIADACNIQIGIGDFEQKTVLKEAFEAEDGKDLKIEIAGAQLSIKESPDDKFDVESDVHIYEWDCSGNEIRLTASEKFIGVNSKGNITLYIPKDYKFDEVKMECGAANVKIDNINCGKTKLEVGAGDVSILNASMEELKAEVGAGNLKLAGEINGDVKIECGMGNVKLLLNQNEKEFNYKLEKALGNVKINDHKYNGFVDDIDISNDAQNNMKIECAMGNVDVSTN